MKILHLETNGLSEKQAEKLDLAIQNVVDLIPIGGINYDIFTEGDKRTFVVTAEE